MKFIRRSIIYLSVLMGLWVASGFISVMFSIGDAEFWTTSLMWSLLASVFVMPGLVVAYHMSSRPAKTHTAQPTQSSTPSPSEQPPFIEDEEREGALWPKPEKNYASDEDEARR